MQQVMEYERIGNLIEDKDWSQEYVASLLCISQRNYSHYEKGERGLPTDVLIKLADIHKTSVDYLLNRTNNPKPLTSLSKLKPSVLLLHTRT